MNNFFKNIFFAITTFITLLLSSCEEAEDAETTGEPARDIIIETEIRARDTSIPPMFFFSTPGRNNASSMARFEPGVVLDDDGNETEFIQTRRNFFRISNINQLLLIDEDPTDDVFPRLPLPDGSTIRDFELFFVIRDVSEGVSRRIWDFYELDDEGISPDAVNIFRNPTSPSDFFDFFDENFIAIEDLSEYTEPVLLMRPKPGAGQVSAEARLFDFFEDGLLRERPFLLGITENDGN